MTGQLAGHFARPPRHSQQLQPSVTPLHDEPSQHIKMLSSVVALCHGQDPGGKAVGGGGGGAGGGGMSVQQPSHEEPPAQSRTDMSCVTSEHDSVSSTLHGSTEPPARMQVPEHDAGGG